jgi:glycosyltransferase involved in cell wall biosynthesis
MTNGREEGLDKYLWNFLETVYSENLQIDVLTYQKDEKLEIQAQAYHANVFEIPTVWHPFKQYQVLSSILEESYDVVYLNPTTAMDWIASYVAWKKKVPKRLLHSHFSGMDRGNFLQRHLGGVFHSLGKLLLWRFGTKLYGDSVKAGEWMFPRGKVHSTRFEVLHPTVEQRRFKFHEMSREIARKEYHVRDSFVVGHVGDFCYAKNYPFLLQIFKEIHKMQPNAVLLLVGEGEQKEKIKRQVRSMGLERSVRFVDGKTDKTAHYQAMDVFVLPSHFEGFPMVGVEAQCTGLPCVMSDVVTKESKITNTCYFLSLSRTPRQWAQFILHHTQKRGSAQFTKEAKHYDSNCQRMRWRQLIYGEGEIEIDVFGKYHYSNL